MEKENSKSREDSRKQYNATVLRLVTLCKKTDPRYTEAIEAEKKERERKEEEARKRGCQYVLLDTFEFQAPEFYKKKGYREVFVYMEHEITGTHYYLSKKLLKG